MCKDDNESRMVAVGYRSALKSMGFDVLVYTPKTKLQTKDVIDKFDVDIIFTTCKYGLKQLPIEKINEQHIKVIVDVLPCKKSGLYIDGPYEQADQFDIEVVEKLNHVLLKTVIEPSLWDEYLSDWVSTGKSMCHTPYAGNLFVPQPRHFSNTFPLSFIGSFKNKRDRMKSHIMPIIHRLEFVGIPYDIIGDDSWSDFYINGRKAFISEQEKSDYYGNSIVSPNFHSTKQIETQAYLNERSFAIQLCGGLQITDMPLASSVFDNNVFVADTPAKFISLLEDLMSNTNKRFDRIVQSVTNAAYNHTYFNRLHSIFSGLYMNECAEKCDIDGKRLANLHIWSLEPKLKAAKAGEQYEPATKC